MPENLEYMIFALKIKEKNEHIYMYKKVNIKCRNLVPILLNHASSSSCAVVAEKEGGEEKRYVKSTSVTTK